MKSVSSLQLGHVLHEMGQFELMSALGQYLDLLAFRFFLFFVSQLQFTLTAKLSSSHVNTLLLTQGEGVGEVGGVAVGGSGFGLGGFGLGAGPGGTARHCPNGGSTVHDLVINGAPWHVPRGKVDTTAVSSLTMNRLTSLSQTVPDAWVFSVRNCSQSQGGL